MGGEGPGLVGGAGGTAGKFAVGDFLVVFGEEGFQRDGWGLGGVAGEVEVIIGRGLEFLFSVVEDVYGGISGDVPEGAGAVLEANEYALPIGRVVEVRGFFAGEGDDVVGGVPSEWRW